MKTLCRSMAAVLVAALLAGAAPVYADDVRNPFDGVGVEPRTGVTVPTDGAFADETGRDVHLSDYLGGPPVLLVPVYYTCPNLCGSTLADVAAALGRTPLAPGRDYRLVVVSIDPREGPADAQRAREKALTTAAAPALDDAAHFLTGSGAAALMQAIGFHYRWDDRLQQYSHVSGAALLTPQGRLERWLPGVGLEPAELRLAVTQVGRGGIGDLAQRFLLLCSHYDPRTGQYTGAVEGLLRLGGGALVVLLGGSIVVALLRERRRRRSGEAA